MKTGSRSVLMMVGMLFALPLLTSCTASPSDLSATVATDPITVTCRVTQNGTYPNINFTTAAESSQKNDPSTKIENVRFNFASDTGENVWSSAFTVNSAGDRVYTAQITTGQAETVTAFYSVGGVEVRSQVSTDCVGYYPERG